MIAVVVPSRHHDADVKDQAADAGTKGGKSPPPTLLSPRRMTSLPQPVPPSKDMPSNTTADTDDAAAMSPHLNSAAPYTTHTAAAATITTKTVTTMTESHITVAAATSTVHTTEPSSRGQVAMLLQQASMMTP
eukprot:CAMPEP_0194393180 /NCGR_PEP_ID=MMETSP0174-20130528/123156_1 /TAXON_ID=216777 /ORGANISM="Proboscia alata, Strain PI-D3" /LENGTH=132 /DNA_ID=CAMNT_0039188839 /DNA_START=1196 /DNA_END=1595 /DNA_ORIENTATION=+